MTMHDSMKGDFPRDDQDRTWADDRLEAWLDGELGDDDARRFADLLSSDDWLQSETDRARLISAEFDAMSDAPCPDEVTKAVMAHVRRDWLFALPRQLSEGFSRMASAGLRPALAMFLLLVVVISSTQIARGPGAATGEDAEVARALQDVKMALAVLADASQTTGTTVGDGVIGPYVVRPMAKGMNSVIEN